jgi:hypothetical protein
MKEANVFAETAREVSQRVLLLSPYANRRNRVRTAAWLEPLAAVNTSSHHDVRIRAD